MFSSQRLREIQPYYRQKALRAQGFKGPRVGGPFAPRHKDNVPVIIFEKRKKRFCFFFLIEKETHFLFWTTHMVHAVQKESIFFCF